MVTKSAIREHPCEPSRQYHAHCLSHVRATNIKSEGALHFGNFGAVLNSDQGAETVSTSDLLQAMSQVQHELEEAEVRTHGHWEHARTV